MTVAISGWSGSCRAGLLRVGWRWFALALVSAGVLVVVPSSRAGGDFVDLAVRGDRVWFVGAAGVRSLDAGSGREVVAARLGGAPYPLGVTLAGGAAWVASVENGFVWGTLSRVDERSGHVRVVWRRRARSVQAVASGAGSVWALIGSASGMQVARFSLTGRLVGTWKVADAARIAADESGCWIASGGGLERIDEQGRLHHVLSAEIGGVTAGAGAIWMPRAMSVLRFDERTTQVQSFATGDLRLGGFPHDIAVDGNELWVLGHTKRGQSVLSRFDIQTKSRTGRVTLPGNANAVAVTAGSIWVATVLDDPPGAGYAVIRLDPRTLHRTRTIRII